MKRFLSVLLLSVAALAAVAPYAEAKRLGGGSNIGRQSSSPAMREAPREAPRAAPAPAPSQPAAMPGAGGVPAKPSFMSRYGGMIAGLGAGALLASMFGGSLGGLGSALGGILNILLIAGALYLVYRFFIARRKPAATAGPMQFAGAGGPSFGAAPFQREPAASQGQAQPVAAATRPQVAVAPTVNVPPGFEIEPFVRQAQTSFLRLQAANDDRDLTDLRDTTTPEVYAELSMQIRERGDAPQKTDVVTLDAQLLEVVVENGLMIASLRYSGMIRENVDGPATPFDEVWHLRRSATASNDPWLIAGIQQLA